MTREDARTWIERLLDTHREMSLVFNRLEDLVGSEPESPFCAACWLAFEHLTTATEHIIGDTSETLTWYIWENECGARAMTHSEFEDRAMREVKTVDDLLDVLGY